MRNKGAIFIAGLLLGLMITYCLQGQKIEKLYWERENLKVELYETREQMKKLKEIHDISLPVTVKEIKIEINPEESPFVEPELRRHVYDLVKGILGQEVRALPYPLLLNILENRVIEIEDKKFFLNVEAIIIGETVVYYLKAKKAPGEETS